MGMSWVLSSLILYAIICSKISAFYSLGARIQTLSKRAPEQRDSPTFRSSVLNMSKNQVGKVVEIDVPMDGENVRPIPISLRPIFARSEFFLVTYDVPFGLNVDKPPKNFPAPIVTKDGKGGEKVGDVLRATSCWSQGFNAAGATSDIMSFAGNVKWRRSVFDTTGAPWEQVVQALTSNTNERCSQVSLVFEREIEDEEDQEDPSGKGADE